MPKLGCNGFSMFAEQMRPHLEELTGKKLTKFNELMIAAGPYWEQVDEDEKRNWKDRAKDYKRSDNYQVMKKTIRLKGVDNKQQKKLPVNPDNLRVSSGGWGDPDLADPDFPDPMELPGPVQRTVARGPPGSIRAFDLVEGPTEQILKLVEKLHPVKGTIKHIESPHKKKSNREIPPRFRAAGLGGNGDVGSMSLDTSGESMDDAGRFKMEGPACRCLIAPGSQTHPPHANQQSPHASPKKKIVLPIMSTPPPEPVIIYNDDEDSMNDADEDSD